MLNKPQQSDFLEKLVKKFMKKMENKLDVGQYQELLFWIASLKCASDTRGHNLIIPGEASWDHLKTKIQLPGFSEFIFNALKDFENSNAQLRGLFNINHNWEALPEEIIKLIFKFIDSMPETVFPAMDIFGQIYELLNSVTLSRKSGIFLTPDCIAKLMTDILSVSEGVVYDPCCGTGTMFIHATNRSNGNVNDKIQCFGQESNFTLHRICRINLALRGIKNHLIVYNRDGTLLKDAFSFSKLPENSAFHLRADFILLNPPFNDTKWGRERLKTHPLWGKKKLPQNANYLWLMHAVCHLAPNGRAAVLMPKSSLIPKNVTEKEIHQFLFDSGVIEGIIELPDKLFKTTNIPCCIWILNRPKMLE